MRRTIPFAFVLTAALAVAALAKGETAKLTEGTPVVVVGVISSQPRDAGVTVENKMQVAVGPERTDYTLHLKDAKLYGFHGEEIARSDFQDKMWVRAEGYVMDDPRRIDVQRLQVIGANMSSIRNTPYFVRGYPEGYVIGTGEPVRAKAYTEGTPVALVGTISSPPRGAIGEQKAQVAIGPARVDYSIHFSDAELYDEKGNKIDEDGLDSGQWVRAEGWVMDDPRRIKIARLHVLGKNSQDYSRSSYFRRGFNQGYVMSTDRLQDSTETTVSFNRDTPVVILGEISSPPRGYLGEQKMQVAVGPAKTDYTLHFSKATLLDINGRKLDEDQLDDGQWVRAEGHVMNSPRRLRVTRLQVIARDTPELQRSAFYRPGLEHGFVTSVAGVRQTFPESPASATRAAPIILVGKVSDDTGALETTRKIQVMAAGNEWTLHVPEEAQVIDAKGEKISVHSIDDGQWIRAHGWRTDDLRMRVFRVENIGRDEALRASSHFRPGNPLGYVESVPESAMTSATLTGTVTAVNADEGLLTIKTADGTTHVIWMPGSEITIQGRDVGTGQARVGDDVSIVKHTFR